MLYNNKNGGKEEMTREKEILERFKKGKRIENEEEDEVLERYAITGMVRFGVDLEELKAEAILTERGKWFLTQM